MKYQHGDVLVKSFDGILPKKSLITNIILKSDVTGHSHHLLNGKFSLKEGKEKELFLNVISKSVDLVHEEHHTINIPKGKYKITFVREYDHFLEEARQVID
jgi:hypothetical protein